MQNLPFSQGLINLDLFFVSPNIDDGIFDLRGSLNVLTAGVFKFVDLSYNFFKLLMVFFIFRVRQQVCIWVFPLVFWI